MLKNCLCIVSVIVILSALYFVRFLDDEKSPTEKLFPAYKIIGSVPTFEWDINKPFVEEISKQRKPALLKNTFINKWKALKKWDIKYISQKSKGKNFEVKVNSQSIFSYYNKDQPLSEFVLNNESKVPIISRMTIEKFWSLSKDENSGFLYFSTNIKYLPDLLDDLDKQDYLQVNEGEGGHASFLWMGKKGVTAQTHYDESHNFYAQIHGSKRFILSSPSQYLNLSVAGFLHPNQRESQLNLFESHVKIEAMEVLLNPGDLLYIPPYWFHCVISESNSISVNTWSESLEGDTRILMERVALPLEEEWDEEKKEIAVYVYFNLLKDKLTQTYPKVSSLPLLLNQRYSLINNNEEKRLTCKDNSENIQTTKAKLYNDFEDGDHWKIVLGIIQNLNDEDIIVQIVADYFEDVAYLLFGIERTIPFIKQCLAN